MMDKAFVATKLTRSTAHNDKWAEVLACEFENEEGGLLTVHLTKHVAQQLGIPKESWPWLYADHGAT